MLDDCKYLKKKPIVTVRSLYVKRKESRGFISHGSENESIQWEEIADCGYRVTIGTFGIEVILLLSLFMNSRLLVLIEFEKHWQFSDKRYQ